MAAISSTADEQRAVSALQFKKLFSFKKKEIDQAFSHAKFHAKMPGFKLLKSFSTEDFGTAEGLGPAAAGKAHDRNLIRRQIKSIFYEEKLYQNQHVFILLVYRQAIDLSFEEIKNFLVENLS
ncbi:ribonuclease P protein component [Candidatus Babeliales bacterium]|nr:ribonuclease P protein component [Candidatus Babeliales bacterium]